MTAATWHTYQVLTKRAERLQSLLKGKLRFAAEQNHIWWEVSVENGQHGLPRVDLLRQSPAKVRFLSIEPLLEHLGAMNLKGISWVPGLYEHCRRNPEAAHVRRHLGSRRGNDPVEGRVTVIDSWLKKNALHPHRH